jgi:aldehyde dehydrogenase (NAD+)
VQLRCLVPCAAGASAGVPFGGYKDSDIGREKSEYALHSYTQVKAVYQPIKETTAWR